MDRPKSDANTELNTNLKEQGAPAKKGKFGYAFGCAILASMTSILLGYGKTFVMLLSS